MDLPDCRARSTSARRIGKFVSITRTRVIGMRHDETASPELESHRFGSLFITATTLRGTCEEGRDQVTSRGSNTQFMSLGRCIARVAHKRALEVAPPVCLDEVVDWTLLEVLPFRCFGVHSGCAAFCCFLLDRLLRAASGTSASSKHTSVNDASVFQNAFSSIKSEQTAHSHPAISASFCNRTTLGLKHVLLLATWCVCITIFCLSV